MDYEKLYKEAISRADKHYARHIVEDIFPELKESEDEKVRKELYKYFRDLQLSSDREFSPTISIDEILAWLEKQKCLTTDEDKQGKEDVLWCIEQARKNAKDENDMGTCWLAEKWLEKQGEQNTTTQYNYVKFREGDIVQKITGDKDIVTIAEVDTKAEVYRLTNTGFIPFKYEHLWHIVEQNPAWSEESDKRYKKILDLLSGIGVIDDLTYEESQKLQDYFKSLKPNNWKPSEEQLKALKNTIIGKRGPLYDLYFDLEKL